MIKRTCENCKWWVSVLEGFTLGQPIPCHPNFKFCNRLSPQGIQDRLGYTIEEIESPIIINVSEWFLGIQTNKDFGCILWEPETKLKTFRTYLDGILSYRPEGVYRKLLKRKA